MSSVNSNITGEDPDGDARSSLGATGGELPYATAAAFRTALKVRFTEIAKHDSRFSVAELQRQFAYDRILSRCFSADDADRWMLKGAGALLARLPVARHSKDIDLYYAECAAAPDASVAEPRIRRHADDQPQPLPALSNQSIISAAASSTTLTMPAAELDISSAVSRRGMRR